MKKNPFDLSGRTVVVTGASSGLGRSMAIAYGEAGASVVLAARRKEALEETAKAVRAAGAEALPVVSDLATSEGNDKLAAEALGWKGGVDVLVNNAGATLPTQFLDSTDEAWLKLFNINLFGIVRLTRAVGKSMAEKKKGSVIMVGSVLGRTAMSNTVPYSVSKGAIEQLTRALGVEWAKYNVRVNLIAPGYFETEMTESAQEPGKTYDYIVKRTPMRRFGKAEEIVSAALYLASDASSYTTGSIVHVDGGWAAG